MVNPSEKKNIILYNINVGARNKCEIDCILKPLVLQYCYISIKCTI